MKVTVNHARQCNYCAKGIRLFCQRYNINFKDFIKNGISKEHLLETNDQLAINLVKKAEEK